MKKLLFAPIIFFFLVAVIFLNPIITQNKLPIPADTIIGLYHPFRDLYAKDYPNGIPYKNFLITDPVRQQYPWKSLAIEIETKLELPLWNPYNFAGTPLLANFQSGAFYPLNVLFTFLSFSTAWSVLIVLQPLLSGVFLYLYLRNLKLDWTSCALGSIIFSFCGFATAWLEWGTIGHTAAWLPLILLSIDKIIANFRDSLISNFKLQISNKQIKIKKYLIWALVLLFSLTSSFFAGHLQTFFYLSLLTIAYFFTRWRESGKSKALLTLFLIITFLFIILSVVQWLPTLNFIDLSARSIDQDWQKVGWFIPWQNIVQFIAPDFFGNPTTLNYWGVWNYGEFAGYVGILPLVMALFAILYRRDRETNFFVTVLFLSLVFSFPTFLAKLPFILEIPFLSSAQPTRLLFLSDFALAILAALGSNILMNRIKLKRSIYPLLIIGAIFTGLWLFVLFGGRLVDVGIADSLLISKRNLLLPSILFLISAFLVLALGHFKEKKYLYLILPLIILVTIFDLLRFNSKFISFSQKDYLYPMTRSLDFLQKQEGEFRIMSAEDRLMPPNFSIMYKLQSIDGYDPLYLLRYGELMAAIGRDKPDISSPFGFNRIITLHNINSRYIDLLGVKYILSLKEIDSPRFKKVFTEGETRVYENNQSFKRAFFVNKVIPAQNKNEAITQLFAQKNSLEDNAIVEEWDIKSTNFTKGNVARISYNVNSVTLDVESKGDAFLILMDSYYPTWKAEICSSKLQDCKKAKIYISNFNFRGIVIPKGEHKVVFNNHLL